LGFVRFFNFYFWIRGKSQFQELVSGMVKYDLENNDFGGKE